MKIQLVVRFNGYPVDDLELQPGEYTLGRNPEKSININHPSIHRNHGRIFFIDGLWKYEDLSLGDVVSITDQLPIRLTSNIELATIAYVASEKTGEVHVSRWGMKTSKEKVLFGSLAAVGLLVLATFAYFLVRAQGRHSDPNVLLSQVRSKVVEFEKIKNEAAIKDYMELGGFDEKDFRDNVGYCTGFLVAPNVVLTASHCLWGSDYLDLQTDFELRAFDGKKFKPVRVLGFDSIRDYLYLEMAGMESYGHLDFADSYKIGQTVYTLGNAHGQGIAIREGIMASETEDVNDANIKYIRFSAGASPGNSGGPLLDIDGRIVALVFAATGAENYNLGTSVYDIKKGFDAFVHSKKPQEIKIIAKKLFQFNPHAFLSKQILPYLSDYSEYPELAQKVLNMEFTFKTPIEFDKIPETILGEVFAKSELVVEQVEKELLSKGEIILDWKSFATPKHPAIHPSQFDNSQNSFYKIKDRFYMKLSGFLDSPNKKEFKQYDEQFIKEKKFDFQAYGMNTELVVEDGISVTYMPKDSGKTRQYFEELAQGTLYTQFILDAKVTDENIVDRFLKNYFGSEGVLTSSYSAFIKPQSYKQFFIKEIKKKPDVTDVKDGSGREWKRFHILLFDNLHLYIYCMNLPEGATCAARILPVDNDYRLSLVEGHFREHILSHFLENPYFWKPQAIAKFKETANGSAMTSMRGLDFLSSGAGYVYKIPYFSLQFKLPPNMQSTRLQTGIYRDSEQGPFWTGYAVDWIQSGTSREVCGVGVEPKGTQSSFVLNFERDMQKKLKLKEEKDIQKEEMPKYWTQEIKAKNGIELIIYGYCAPIRENPIDIGYYFVDYKKARPLKANYVQ
jgi:S1-C subfamily serine protease